MSEVLKTPETQAEPQNVSAEEQKTDASPQVEKKTPAKRTRLSFIERAQKESEELVKNLGGSLEMEGGRRTRSSARGTPTGPAATPPPTKKSRNSPASPKAATPRGRGRGRKLDTSVTPEPPESKEKAEQNAEKPEENETKPAEVEKATKEPEKSAKTDEESVVDAAKTKESSETNGPEKSEADNVNEAAEKCEKSETAAEKQAEDKVKSAVEEKKPADQVDAAVLETIQEKSSQPAEEVEQKTETEKANEPAAVINIADSPMEVDEQSNSAASASKANEVTAPVVVEKAAETAVASIEPPVVDVEKSAVTTAVEKQPTPEPMEVDSSSKSSDVIECTDVVDKSNDEVVAQKVQNTSNDNESTNSHAEPAAIVPQQQAPVSENNLKGEINANVTTNDIPAVKSINEPVIIGEPHVDNNKNENDVDQQKHASAATQLNAAAVGDAPVNAAIPTSL